MKKWLVFAPLIIVLTACSVKQPDAQQQQFISEFGRELKLPLLTDSAFIAGLDTLEAMDIPRLEEIKKDSVNKDFAGELGSSIDACIFIEKLKQNGRYQGYLDSLNTGMLKNAMAFKVGKINMGDNFYLLLWGINEGSFDADPGYSSISIIASYPKTGGGFEHMVVAEEYNAGDPPSMMSRRTKGEIKAGEIRINSRTAIEDLDAGSKATETKFLRLQAEDGELTTLQKVIGK